MIFQHGAADCEDFLKAHETLERKIYFSCERFVSQEKLSKTQKPSNEALVSKLDNNNRLRKKLTQLIIPQDN